MANRRGLSNAELELELHGLPEDCSDSESNVSDEDLSPASNSDEDFISRPSSSPDSDENLESLESYTFSVNQIQIGQLRDRSSNFISYASEASTSNCSQLESRNATTGVCVTTFHEENGTRPSLEDGSRHVGKDKTTIWTVTAHNINTHGKFSAQNVLKEAADPIAHARRNVTEGSVSSSWRMFIDDSMLRHIKKCTETEVRRHGAENSSLSLEELDAFIALLYARGAYSATNLKLHHMWSNVWGPPVFSQTMGRNRFKEIVRYLSFDMKNRNDELRPRGESLPENVVIRLMEPYLTTGRNGTTDNFFTSLKLAERLKAMQTSIVGTMKRTRKEIPAVNLSVPGPAGVKKRKLNNIERTSTLTEKELKEKMDKDSDRFSEQLYKCK
ncbi:hypothetical protein ILUMI_11255 [Ignelater luminosus]|uniref:PiggyBac transposable element-derived protein domain-containing protein n=1 Tax=Ignelater luminosus TaxID=2038154 RepID=A0A8K0CYS9_IGNLU|nr:hypothetical protein ILUMI_11255 [Ignelater luminosus]